VTNELEIMSETRIGQRGNKTRRIIKPPEFSESSWENIIKISPALVGESTVSHSPTTNATLKPSKSVSVGCKISNSYRVSVATSISGHLNILAVTS
jgi:hypothetical protein